MIITKQMHIGVCRLLRISFLDIRNRKPFRIWKHSLNLPHLQSSLVINKVIILSCVLVHSYFIMILVLLSLWHCSLGTGTLTFLNSLLAVAFLGLCVIVWYEVYWKICNQNRLTKNTLGLENPKISDHKHCITYAYLHIKK